MSILKGVSSAEPANRGRYFEPGQHKVEIVRCQIRQSKNPKTPGATHIIVESRIVESTVHEPGEVRSWVVQVGGLTWREDLKAFGLALFGREFSDEEFEAAFEGSGERHAGDYLQLTTWKRPSGWTVHDWSPSE